MNEEPDLGRSRFGLDAETSLFARLGSTLTLLMIGVVIGLIYLTIDSRVCAGWPAWLKFLARAGCEAVGFFFAVGLVYVWWRPAWLRRIYLRAENKLFHWFDFLAIVGVLCLVAAIVMMLFFRK